MVIPMQTNELDQWFDDLIDVITESGEAHDVDVLSGGELAEFTIVMDWYVLVGDFHVNMLYDEDAHEYCGYDIRMNSISTDYPYSHDDCVRIVEGLSVRRDGISETGDAARGILDDAEALFKRVIDGMMGRNV